MSDTLLRTVGEEDGVVNVAEVPMKDRRKLIQRSMEGNFTTRSNKETVRGAIAILNDLKMEMETYHRPTGGASAISLILPPPEKGEDKERVSRHPKHLSHKEEHVSFSPEERPFRATPPPVDATLDLGPEGVEVTNTRSGVYRPRPHADYTLDGRLSPISLASGAPPSPPQTPSASRVAPTSSELHQQRPMQRPATGKNLPRFVSAQDTQTSLSHLSKEAVARAASAGSRTTIEAQFPIDVALVPPVDRSKWQKKMDKEQHVAQSVAGGGSSSVNLSAGSSLGQSIGRGGIIGAGVSAKKGERLLPTDTEGVPSMEAFEPISAMELATSSDASPMQQLEAIRNNRLNAAEKMKKSIGWLSYWGDIESLKLVHENLMSQIEFDEKQIAALTTQCTNTWEVYEKSRKNLKDIELTLQKEREESSKGREVDRQQLSSLKAENELLMAKTNEMRRQVTMAESAMKKYEHDAESALRQTAKAKAELEKVKLEQAVEIVKLRHEATAWVKKDTEREVRLLYLEDENSRQADQLKTLSKTIDVFRDEIKMLKEKNVALSSGMGQQQAQEHRDRSRPQLDTTALQQLTQKSFQKREKELLEQMMEMRHDNERKDYLVEALKDRYQTSCRKYEQNLLRRCDVDAATGIAFTMPMPKASAAQSGGAKKPGGKQARKQSVAVRYTCTPISVNAAPRLVLDDLRSQLEHSAFMKAVEYIASSSHHVDTVVAAFSAVLTPLWAHALEAMPNHPTGSPEGQKEQLHKSLVDHVSSLQNALKMIIDGSRCAVQAIVEQEAELRTLKTEEFGNLRSEEVKKRLAVETRSQELVAKMMTAEVTLTRQEKQIENSRSHIVATVESISSMLEVAAPSLSVSFASVRDKAEANRLHLVPETDDSDEEIAKRLNACVTIVNQYINTASDAVSKAVELVSKKKEDSGAVPTTATPPSPEGDKKESESMRVLQERVLMLEGKVLAAESKSSQMSSELAAVQSKAAKAEDEVKGLEQRNTELLSEAAVAKLQQEQRPMTSPAVSSIAGRSAAAVPSTGAKKPTNTPEEPAAQRQQKVVSTMPTGAREKAQEMPSKGISRGGSGSILRSSGSAGRLKLEQEKEKQKQPQQPPVRTSSSAAIGTAKAAGTTRSQAEEKGKQVASPTKSMTKVFSEPIQKSVAAATPAPTPPARATGTPARDTVSAAERKREAEGLQQRSSAPSPQTVVAPRIPAISPEVLLAAQQSREGGTLGSVVHVSTSAAASTEQPPLRDDTPLSSTKAGTKVVVHKAGATGTSPSSTGLAVTEKRMQVQHRPAEDRFWESSQSIVPSSTSHTPRRDASASASEHPLQPVGRSAVSPGISPAVTPRRQSVIVDGVLIDEEGRPLTPELAHGSVSPFDRELVPLHRRLSQDTADSGRLSPQATPRRKAQGLSPHQQRPLPVKSPLQEQVEREESLSRFALVGASLSPGRQNLTPPSPETKPLSVAGPMSGTLALQRRAENQQQQRPHSALSGIGPFAEETSAKQVTAPSALQGKTTKRRGSGSRKEVSSRAPVFSHMTTEADTRPPALQGAVAPRTQSQQHRGQVFPALTTLGGEQLSEAPTTSTGLSLVVTASRSSGPIGKERPSTAAGSGAASGQQAKPAMSRFTLDPGSLELTGQSTQQRASSATLVHETKSKKGSKSKKNVMFPICRKGDMPSMPQGATYYQPNVDSSTGNVPYVTPPDLPLTSQGLGPAPPSYQSSSLFK